ncbi:MAG TPA: hypothetical protein VKU01_25050 [Bryobacteraceae bacterium]|nr:hypothetical protein [Bryobacteraceae bacterium]
MPNRRPDDDLLARALAPGKDCLSIEDLEQVLEERASVPLRRHVKECPHCQAELHLLQAFTRNEITEEEKPAVEHITARLRDRSREIAPRPIYGQDSPSWWKRLFATPWLTPAIATLALVLIVAGIAFQMRQSRQPSLDTSPGGTQVLRSSAVAVLSPLGDIFAKPSEIRWEAVPRAARYRVRLLEVDRSELWSAETATPNIYLPATVQTAIVPAKTLLIQVSALDAAGLAIAESELARFRLVQSVPRP